MSDPHTIERQEKIGVGTANVAGVEQMLNDVTSLSADWFYNWSPRLPANDVANWYVGAAASTISNGSGNALRLSGAEGWAAQTVKVSAGTTLTLSFDAHSLAGAGGVVVEYRDTAGKVISWSFVEIGASADRYSISAVVGPSVVEARIVAYATPAGQIEIDNLALSVGSNNLIGNGDFEAKASEVPVQGFVPMIKNMGQMTELASIAAAHPGGTLLTFNEPDEKAQANMTVAQALSYWPALMASGMRLSSPAVTVNSTLGEKSWLGKFMTAADANGYRVDFVAVHYYTTDTSVEAFAKFLNSVHEAYGRPVWVTEWSLADWNNSERFTAEQQAAFFVAATQMMDDLPFVERHAWYAAYEGLDSWFLNSGLIEGAGSFSAVGQAFAVLATADTPAETTPAPDAVATPLGTDGNDVLMGGDRAEVISGLAGNDVIEGRGGADRIDGGPGIDVASYANSASGVQVDLAAAIQKSGDAEGDVLINIENVRGSDHDDVLKGDAGANALTGMGGNDRLVFSGGYDVMDGGSGTDTADFSGSGRHLGANLETGVASSRSGKVTLIDIENLIGTDHSDMLTGNDLANVLIGGAGDDTLHGGGGDDALHGGDGHDRLYGGEGNDTLEGGEGKDTLDGGVGADTMRGGAGNDIYYVDNAADIVEEAANGGTDTVRSFISRYVLGEDVENLVLAGTAGQVGIGNELNNTISGSAGADMLIGGAGHDRLHGGEGNDTLEGGEGKDTLDGGVGADTMRGGAGNDIYYVDNAADIVEEAANGGTDTVRSFISRYVLGENLENLVLAGTAGQVGIGNELNNTISGSAGADMLIGGAGNDNLDGKVGADCMDGGTGDDTFYVDDPGDVVIERIGEGTDTVRASISGYTLAPDVENLTLTGKDDLAGNGNDLNNALTGNAGANAIRGGAGNDRITGGAGSDQLWGDDGDDVLIGGLDSDWLSGGAGKDVFVFATGDSTPSNPDIIADFTSGADIIDLSAIDANTSRGGNQTFSFIGSSAFSHSAGQLRYERALDADGHSYTLVQADVNGDAVSDFALHLHGFTTELAFTDFML